ncbi:hypothetical protein MRBLWO14_000993 [Microbacterium sp. LWO14-1.2]|uniref:hypothetical protein n=1 Tax=Microbacterium sp. LWO14-1.2 TaxID=3135263 RepID=UPI003138E84E
MVNQITLIDGSRSLVFPAITSHGWYFHSLDGWYGQTGNKQRGDERPQDHGAFRRRRALRTSRAFSFKTGYRDGSPEEVEAATADLSSFGADGEILIIVEDALGRTQRVVNVDIIDDQDTTRRYTGDMIVGLTADDPRRYSVASDVPWQSTTPPSPGLGRTWPSVRPLVWPGGGSTGRITLTNTGKAASAPVLRLNGGSGTALITTVETGARIGFDRLIPVGSIVEIDTATYTAIIDGQSDVSRWLRYREWETIPAESSRSYQFDVTDPVGSPTLEGRVLSAWA